MNQRGFVLIEFVIALPLLILLLYALGTMTLQSAKIAREQVADYVLETEAQEVIDRITNDAKTANSIEIKNFNAFDEIILTCHANKPDLEDIYDVLDTKIYRVYAAQGKLYHVYFNHREDTTPTNPITGENSFGNTFVTDLKFSVPAPKLLHVTLEMKSYDHDQKVKFSTAVYMPACEEIIYHGVKIL